MVVESNEYIGFGLEYCCCELPFFRATADYANISSSQILSSNLPGRLGLGVPTGTVLGTREGKRQDGGV